MHTDTAPTPPPGCLRIADSLTVAQAAALHLQLREWMTHGAGDLDLSGVEECDSAGVQLLCALQHGADRLGHGLRLQAPSDAVCEALRRYGLDAQLAPLRRA